MTIIPEESLVPVRVSPRGGKLTAAPAGLVFHDGDI
jgi:hypothetical protein